MKRKLPRKNCVALQLEELDELAIVGSDHEGDQRVVNPLGVFDQGGSYRLFHQYASQSR